MFNSLNLIIVDATFTDGLGRMVNDNQPKKSNWVMKKIKGETKDIEKGEELRYDFGVKDLPWCLHKGTTIELINQFNYLSTVQSQSAYFRSFPFLCLFGFCFFVFVYSGINIEICIATCMYVPIFVGAIMFACY